MHWRAHERRPAARVTPTGRIERHGPASGTDTTEVRKRVKAQGIEAKSLYGRSLIWWPISRRPEGKGTMSLRNYSGC